MTDTVFFIVASISPAEFALINSHVSSAWNFANFSSSLDALEDEDVELEDEELSLSPPENAKISAIITTIPTPIPIIIFLSID